VIISTLRVNINLDMKLNYPMENHGLESRKIIVMIGLYILSYLRTTVACQN